MSLDMNEKYADLDRRLHDDFLKLDEEEAKDPGEKSLDSSKSNKHQKEVLISETNQDGLMSGHNPF